MMLLVGVCLGVLSTLAVQWAMRPKQGKRLEFPTKPEAQETGFLDLILEEETEDEVTERLRRNLRVKVFHNEEQLQRLIEIERKRQPQATMRIWLEGAIERWERDNR